MIIAENTPNYNPLENLEIVFDFVLDEDTDMDTLDVTGKWWVEYQTDEGDWREGIMQSYGISPYWAEERAGIQRAYIVAEDGSWSDYSLIHNTNLIAKVVEKDDENVRELQHTIAEPVYATRADVLYLWLMSVTQRVAGA